MLRFHNTLTGTTDDFAPLEAGCVTIYTCGPTVWNFPHIGNWRAFLFYDLLRRHLRFAGFQVVQVMNLTDIDDRILQEATAARTTIAGYVQPYADAFFADLAALRIQPAEHYPTATGHIPEMVAMIKTLIDNESAYEADGDVYFRVDSFPAYGRLAHIDRGGLRATGRVATDKYEKESLSDFALWKRASAADDEVGAAWDAPFGRGRPGWHIECSAMSKRYLGPTIDIHCGGIDLMFPHHENEIAQSESANQAQFARYWLHSEHLSDATGEKMSKSAGGFTTFRDLVDAGHDPVAIRFFLMTNAHYRAKVRLSDEALRSAAEQVRRLRDFAARVARIDPAGADDTRLLARAGAARAGFQSALDDDLNLPRAMGLVFELLRDANTVLDSGAGGRRTTAALRSLLDDVDAHVDVLSVPDDGLAAEVEGLIAEREAARAARDFARSDEIRDLLRDRGIILEDSRDGVRWRRLQ